MRSTVLMLALAIGALSAAGDAKGTLNYKGKSKDFAVALKYAHFVTGPDAMDSKATIKRLILSTTDLTSKITACKTMDCTDDDLTEGIEIDITGGPRFEYLARAERRPRAVTRARTRRRPFSSRRTPPPTSRARSPSTTRRRAAPSSTRRSTRR